MAKQGSSFLLSAADVTWVRREESCISVTADANALDGLYFNIDGLDSHGGTVLPFYVWFDLDGASTDPAPAGRTGIEVDVVAGETTAQVAVKLAAALEANASFYAKVASVGGTDVQVSTVFGGAITDETADVDTTFTFERSTIGLGGTLGKTSGGVEVALSTESVAITADQTGALVQDEVFTGSGVEVTMSLLEMTQERWKTLVGSVTGDSFTPSGGTELVGYGESRLYQSFFDLGGQLILHPTRKDASDRSFDITLWKCAPKPGSINFSGEEPQVMEITFTALADRSLNSAISLMAFGDHEQDVRI